MKPQASHRCDLPQGLAWSRASIPAGISCGSAQFKEWHPGHHVTTDGLLGSPVGGSEQVPSLSHPSTPLKTVPAPNTTNTNQGLPQCHTDMERSRGLGYGHSDSLLGPKLAGKCRKDLGTPPNRVVQGWGREGE